MRVAIVQTCSSDDLEANLALARDGVKEAASQGARFVTLPENFAYMRREGSPFPCVQGPDGEIVRFLESVAREHSVWLLGGSFPEEIPGDRRVYNTCLLISDEGREVARYRKIHLFDVDLAEDGADSYRESDHFAPGSEVVVGDTPFGGVGLSICYDLRFPELYKQQVEGGARWLTVPSAFTPTTGKDHWEVLLRARAIESQAFVIAPAQCGQHSPDRASHGRSLIIDPWGIVLAQGGDRPVVLVADCDLDLVDRIRASVPSLRNRRLP